MALNLMSLVAKLSMDSSDYEKGLDKARGGLSDFGKGASNMVSTVKKAIAAIGIGVAIKKTVDGVTSLTKSVVNAYGNFEQLAGGVETLFGKSADIVMKNAEQAYKTAGLSANEYMETATSFSASLLQSLGGNTKKAADMADLAIRDMSDNANKMGSDMSSIQNAYQGFAKQNYTMLDNLKLGYGGTKEEMQRLLKDAEKLTGRKFDLSSYADVVEAIHAIQTQMGITGTTAKEASATIEGSIATTKAAWQNVLTSIGKGEGVKKATANLIDSAKNVIKNVIPVVQRAMKGLAEFVVQVAPEVVAKIPALVNAVLPAIASAVPTLAKGIANVLPRLFREITSFIRNKGIPGIAKLIGGLFGKGQSSSLVNHLTKNLQKIFQDVSGILGRIGAKVKEFWTVVVQPILFNLLNFVTKKVLPGIHNALIKLRPILDQIGPAVSAAFQAIADFWSNTLYPVLGQIWDYVVGQLIPGVIEWLGKAIPVVVDAFSKVKEFWDNTLYPVLQTVWTYITDTVVPKVVEAWDKFRDKASEVFGKIKEFWDNTLYPVLLVVWTYIVDTLVPKVVEAWDKFRDKAGEVFGKIEEFWNNTLYPVLAVVWDYIVNKLVPKAVEGWSTFSDKVESVFKDIKQWWEDHGKKAFEGLLGIMNDVWSFITDKLSGAFDTLVGAMNGDKDATDKLKEAFDKLLVPIKWVIDNIETIVPIVSGVVTAIAGLEIIKKIDDITKNVKQTRSAFSKLFKVVQAHPFAAVVTILASVATALITAYETNEDFRNKVDAAWAAVKKCWDETLEPVFSGLGTTIQNIWDTVLKPVAEWVGGTFVDVWNDLQEGLNGLVTFLTGTFTGHWSTAWDGLVAMIETPFNLLKDILKTPINAVIGLINSMIFAVRDAINRVIDGINSHVRIKLDPIFVLGKKVWDGIDVGVNLQRVNWSGIKELARGGILGEGQSAFVGEYAPELLRVIGGKAMVTPLSKVPARFPGGGQEMTVPRYTAPKNIVVKLIMDGKELAHTQFPYLEAEEQRIGLKLAKGGV